MVNEYLIVQTIIINSQSGSNIKYIFLQKSINKFKVKSGQLVLKYVSHHICASWLPAIFPLFL